MTALQLSFRQAVCVNMRRDDKTGSGLNRNLNNRENSTQFLLIATGVNRAQVFGVVVHHATGGRLPTTRTAQSRSVRRELQVGVEDGDQLLM
jgi:hypothetical protein